MKPRSHSSNGAINVVVGDDVAEVEGVVVLLTVGVVEIVEEPDVVRLEVPVLVAVVVPEDVPEDVGVVLAVEETELVAEVVTVFVTEVLAELVSVGKDDSPVRWYSAGGVQKASY